MSKKSIKALILDGAIPEAFEALEPLLSSTDKNTLLLLRSRWNGNERDITKGIVSTDFYKLEYNRIISSLNDLAAKVAPTTESESESRSKSVTPSDGHSPNNF